MTEIEMEARLDGLTTRYRELGGSVLHIVMWPGRWAVTSAGGSPRLSTAGVTADEALTQAEEAVSRLEMVRDGVAKTLGIAAE